MANGTDPGWVAGCKVFLEFLGKPHVWISLVILLALKIGIAGHEIILRYIEAMGNLCDF